MIFHIAALPRSGTAFLSTLFNLSPDVLCYHEAVTLFEDMVAQMEEDEKGGLIVGDCSSALMYPRFDDVPAKRVWIDRGPHEASLSARNTALGDIPKNEFDLKWKYCLENAARWRQKHAPLMVHYEDLFTLPMLESIFNFATNGCAGFPKQKAEILLRNNIQRASLKYNEHELQRRVS